MVVITTWIVFLIGNFLCITTWIVNVMITIMIIVRVVVRARRISLDSITRLFVRLRCRVLQ